MGNYLANFSHQEFLNLLMSGQRSACSKIARNALNEGLNIKDLYEAIFKKALYDIGELWEFNKISVATEHLSSAIIEAVLNEIYSEVISGSKNEKSVIVACVEEEFHQIGIKMISDIFEMNGWTAYFLGANTPVSELISYARIIKPNIFALSLSIYFNFPVLEKMIVKIRKEFPDLPILVGGQAFRYGGKNIVEKYHHVIYQPDLLATELFIKNFK